jgi:hypothetical protein
VAAAAEPLLAERRPFPFREKGGVEIDALADVAEGTVLLVEGGTGITGSFEEERQQQRGQQGEGKNPSFQPAHDPMVRRRSPS